MARIKLPFINKLASWGSSDPLPDQVSDKFFYPIMGSSSIDWSARAYLQDFIQVPELNAVIGWKYRAFSNMRLSVIDRRTEKELEGDPVSQRLRRPNYFQSQKEYLMQTKAFQEIFGNEYLFFLTPVGLPNNVKGIFTIPPQIVRPVIKDKSPYFLRSEQSSQNTLAYVWDNQVYQFPKDSIVHINKPKVNVSANDFITGESIQAGLQAPIRNIKASYEARNVLIENRGALGILSNAAKDGTGSMLPMNPVEKKKLQKEFRNYGVQKDQFQVIMTNLHLNWQQMAIDADKLKLYDETRESFTKICDSYGVNYEIFGSQKGVTFANKQQAEKNTYQDTIIPEALEWVDAFNRYYKVENESWYIKVSFDHLPILQEDLNLRATSLNTLMDALQKGLANGLITQDQAQAELKRFRI